jgi:hypothetical protein
LFDNFLLRTETKNKVETIRANLLIQASKDERLSSNSLPQFQKFLKMMELKRKIQEINKENEKVRRQENIVLEAIYSKGELKLKLMLRNCLNLFSATLLAFNRSSFRHQKVEKRQGAKR